MPVPALLPPAWSPAWPTPPCPVPAVAELQPVAWDYAARLRALEADAFGGRTASAALGPTVAEADVYWRFVAATGRGSALPADAPAVWRDTAVAGSLLALNRLVDETVDRAPQIAMLRGVADAAINPNLELHSASGAPMRVSHRTGGRNARRVQDASIEEGFAPPRHPGLAFGLDWKTKDDDAPPEAPILSWGAWLAVDGLSGASLRADLDLVHDAWTVNLRRRAGYGLALVASARSAARAVTPDDWSVGVALDVPRWRDETIRLERRQSFAAAVPDAAWVLTVRVEHHTAAPRGVAYPDPTGPAPGAPPARACWAETCVTDGPAASTPLPRAADPTATAAR